MKTNYQLETDRITQALVSRPRLLLHSCCGPCSSYVLLYLTQHFDVTLLFYNPNIQPESEYLRRLQTQRKLIENMCPEVKLIAPGWDGDSFCSVSAGLEAEPEGGVRCNECFVLRLDYTARVAKELQFNFICTTLTVSPHKNAAIINLVGQAAAAKYGVLWLPSDFKKRDGYKKSIELSETHGLYRQNYCGCICSLPPHDSQ